MDARRERGEVKSENRGRDSRRSTSETRDETSGRSRERERDARERESEARERKRPTRVRRARGCLNIGDTHEAKRARPEKERSETDRSTGACEQSQTLQRVSDE